MPNEDISTISNVRKASPFLVGTISALVGAILVGGGVFAYENNRTVTVQNDLQSQINNLKGKLAEVNPSASPITSPTVAPTEASAPVYTPVPTATPNVFTSTTLGNSTVVVGANYKLTDGTYIHSGTPPFGPSTYDSIVLEKNSIAIDSTNANQAAIVLTVTEEYPGAMGAGTFEELEVMSNNSGVLSHVSSVALTSLGSSVTRISRVSFASNVVTVTYIAGGKTSIKSYRLAGNTLTKE